MLGNLSVSDTGSSHARGGRCVVQLIDARHFSGLSLILDCAIFSLSFVYWLAKLPSKRANTFLLPWAISSWHSLLITSEAAVITSLDGQSISWWVCLPRNRPALAGPRNMPVGEVQGYRALAWLPARLRFCKASFGGVVMGWTGGIINI